MAIKHQCKDIWELWSTGWIGIPTSPHHPSDKFNSKLGKYLISKFPGLAKNYERLCKVDRGNFALFRSTHTREEIPKKILAYNDLRIPLSPGDYGLILLPDTSSKIIDKETAKTDWEIIEESVANLKEYIKIIPGRIYIPPLGFGKGRLREQEAVDDLMAMFLNYDQIDIIYGINIEETEEETEDKPSNPQVYNNNKTEEESKDESVNVYSSNESYQEWNGENLIDEEFERIEVRLPD